MKRVQHLAKILAGTAAGVTVVGILASAGGEISRRLLVGGDEDNRLSGLAGFSIGGVVGLIVGGYVAGRVLRAFHVCPRRRWLLLIGPGLWAWLALMGPSVVSGGVVTEHLTAQLPLGLAMVLVSFAGSLVGVRERHAD